MKVQSQNLLTKTSYQIDSPLISYYTSSNEYLIKKYSENLNDINLEKSNNFIRKNSYLNQINNENKEESKNYLIQSLNNKNTEKDYKGINNQYSNNNQNNINNNKNLNNLNFNYIDNEKSKNNSMNNINNQSDNLNKNFTPFFSINKSKVFITEMYGRKGWICIFCNNFNYEGRNKCNKCKKSLNQQIININYKNNKFEKNLENINNKNLNFLSGRIGDWICFSCKNLNFAFRDICNRCKISRKESDIFLQQYNILNYITTINNSVKQKIVDEKK